MNLEARLTDGNDNHYAISPPPHNIVFYNLFDNKMWYSPLGKAKIETNRSTNRAIMSKIEIENSVGGKSNVECTMCSPTLPTWLQKYLLMSYF